MGTRLKVQAGSQCVCGLQHQAASLVHKETHGMLLKKLAASIMFFFYQNLDIKLILPEIIRASRIDTN